MPMYNTNDKASKNCDNKADFNLCVETTTTDEEGNQLNGGSVFVSHLLGGKWRQVGTGPYGNGCQKFKADYGTDIKVAPAPAPGFKCVIGRSSQVKMKDKTIDKKFVFECIDC